MEGGGRGTGNGERGLHALLLGIGQDSEKKESRTWRNHGKRREESLVECCDFLSTLTEPDKATYDRRVDPAYRPWPV